MAKDIMTSGIEMSDVIKTTGFPVPEDMEGKTFAECVSGSGGNVTLYAWQAVEDGYSGFYCYTLTENPKVGDDVISGDTSEAYNVLELRTNGVLAVGENSITYYESRANRVYARRKDSDIVLQAGMA